MICKVYKNSPTDLKMIFANWFLLPRLSVKSSRNEPYKTILKVMYHHLHLLNSTAHYRCLQSLQ